MNDVWPICFMGQFRSGQQGLPPALTLLTACRNPLNEQLLREYLASESPISLPKHIIIDDQDNRIKMYLSPRFLTPGSGFTFNETETSFVVSRSQQSGASGGAGDDSQDSDDDHDNSDTISIGHVGNSSSANLAS